MTFFRTVAKVLVKSARREKLTLPVYASLVGHLYGSLSAFMMLPIGGLLLTINDGLHGGGLRAWGCTAVMSVVVAARIEMYRRFKRSSAAKKMTDIAFFEAGAAMTGLTMAVVISITECIPAIVAGTPQGTMASLVLTMGVAGLIGSRTGSRPNLAFIQVVLIVLPFASVLMLTGGAGVAGVGVLVALYLVATFTGIKGHYMSLRRALLDEQRVRRLNIINRKQAQLFDTALNAMTSGLLLLDEKRRILVANERSKEVLGVDLIKRIEGKATHEFQDDLFRTYGCDAVEQARVRGEFDRIMQGGLEGTFTMYDRTRGRIFEMRMRTIPGGEGAVINVDDVTEKRQQEAEISRLAHHDILTGLPNRFSLLRHLEALIALRTGSIVAMFIDLDRFKAVNDEYGHSFGDALLVQVAERLRMETRAEDFASRIAGDEFVIVFSEFADRRAITHAANRILAAISRPYVLLGKTLVIGASAGLSHTEPMRTSAKELLRTADVALYVAKSGGRGQAFWYEKSMDDDARTRREMTSELGEALRGDRLALHYQPIVDVKRKRVVVCEALTRWKSPTYGDVPPSVFIKLAEDSELIRDLGHWSLRRACLDARHWSADIKVAVNISALHFKEGSISRTVAAILEETGLAASRLELEITESMLADDTEKMQFELGELSRAGVTIVLDDFGTGYSSFSRLHALPIDKVKLDGSFVRRLGSDKNAASLIASIVRLTATMGKQLVIEGVETLQEVEEVVRLRGNLIQGFFFSRPVPVSELGDAITRIEAKTRARAA
ncbi:putative Diguanylate cyclase domain protein [Beijerinckiaceae bacterium RH AL1]|nr:EAL domain-containing protein [Beijerinckiaceae bacterium]VVB46016.1 putative Diguanylate cyclase domain protein [Beijerinckiaceae bacterium RH CH11]VVB46096.1 putative Diguanylate cyclase domain protein [Beijerinckiaceae bacterium RH AL8]VVC55159.1 putative Diguanylate cyclase domain protein [Beijerinckiaceae bacterium RH AL1]